MATLAPDTQADRAALTEGLRALFSRAGDDPAREDLVKTPGRWVKAMEELLAGYGVDPKALLSSAIFTSGSDQVVVVRDMPFVSVCEHHVLPFQGRASLAYIPQGGRIAGLSKFPRALAALASRLQVQERLTQQLAEAVEEALSPLGVLVVIDAGHACCELRGARAVGTMMTTSCARGVFLSDPAARAEAFSLFRR